MGGRWLSFTQRAREGNKTLISVPVCLFIRQQFRLHSLREVLIKTESGAPSELPAMGGIMWEIIKFLNKRIFSEWKSRAKILINVSTYCTTVQSTLPWKGCYIGQSKAHISCKGIKTSVGDNNET